MAKLALLSFLVCASAIATEPAIRWEPFGLPAGTHGVRAELGRLTVPLVRTSSLSEKQTAELAFVRLRKGEGDGRSPIVYLAGGPGQAAIGAASNPYALMHLARLADLGDVILLDQRGTGLSTPRPTCPPAPLEPGQVFVPMAEGIARYRESARRCVEEWAAKGVPAQAFTNRESAADIDDLRRALGAKTVRLIGFSYGTHLALAVIRSHGPNVERAVLIATAGLAHMRKLPFMLDSQLGKLSLLVAKDPAIGKDVPDMTALLGRVLRKLDAEPMTITIHDRARKQDVQLRVGSDTLRGFLIADIGDGNDFPFFPALLLTIERGDPTILEWFAEKRYNQRSGINLMHLGMRCSAGADSLRDEQIRREARTSIFANAVNYPFPDVCEALPGIDLGDAYRQPLLSDVPVLFVSGTLDSNTPPYQAEEVRWGMPRASHLIVGNAGHEDLEPHAGVQEVIADYLSGKDVSGRHVALPTPRFRSVEEARAERNR